jgi:carbonic anhydrase
MFLKPLWPVLVLASLWSAPTLARPDLCSTGRRQSPIDITQTQRLALPPLVADYRPAPLRAVNDGHTVRLRFANGSRLLVGGQPQVLTQAHFHITGGDRIQGEDFAMAMHWLHKSPSGQLLAVVLPFRLGAAHPGLARLLPVLPAPGQPEQRDSAVQMDASSLLPANLAYYRYEGSETAPPCTEGVRWLVIKQVQSLSAEQLAALRQRVPPNARPVQPLNGRVVQESL